MIINIKPYGMKKCSQIMFRMNFVGVDVYDNQEKVSFCLATDTGIEFMKFIFPKCQTVYVKNLYKLVVSEMNKKDVIEDVPKIFEKCFSKALKNFILSPSEIKNAPKHVVVMPKCFNIFTTIA